MRTTVFVLAACLAMATLSTEASAAPGDELVVEVKGKRNTGISRLSRALRRRLADKLGGLRSTRELRAEQDRLQIPNKDRTKPSRLAEATRGIGAKHLLFVRFSKKGRTYTAKSYLISAEDGSIAKKLKHTYKSSKRAGVAGREIADATLGALEMITGQPIAVAPPPPPPPEVEVPVVPDLPAKTIEPDPEPDKPSAPSLDPATPVAPTLPAMATDATPTNNTVEAPIAATRSKEAPFEVRLAAGIGAGLVRRYNLSSNTLPTSDLSHSLSPVALIELQGELNVNLIDVGLAVKANFRPVSYAVSADNRIDDPGGLLVDGRFGLNYRWEIAQRDGKPLELLPRAGLQLARSSVGEHQDNIVLSSTAMALLFGAGVRIPYDRQLEFDLGFDLGPVLSYSENPTTSGDGGGGLAFNADFAARYWFTKRISLALASQFSLMRLGFEGAPTRTVARDEVGRIFDASLSVTDFGTALIVGTRF